MAISFDVSSSELLRVSSAAYSGRRLEVFLAMDEDITLNSDSTYAEWKALELPEIDGYLRYFGEIPVGAYDPVQLRHEIGLLEGYDESFPVEFTASGGTYTYNYVVAAIHEPDGAGGWVVPVGVYGIYRAIPEETVFPEQKIQYPVSLVLTR